MKSSRKLFREYNKARTAAARWIYENQNGAQWWTHGVLTRRNNAPNSLNMDEGVAFNIFIDPAQRGLLVPAANGMPGYHLNLGDRAGWDELMDPPGFLETWVYGPFLTMLESMGQFVFWVVSLGISAAVSAWITKAVGGS